MLSRKIRKYELLGNFANRSTIRALLAIMFKLKLWTVEVLKVDIRDREDLGKESLVIPLYLLLKLEWIK